MEGNVTKKTVSENQFGHTEEILISRQKEGIVLTDAEYNREEGTAAVWVKQPLTPKHRFKLDFPVYGLILHNKLGSNTEAENSVIGRDGTITNGPVSYSKVRYGNGFHQSGYSNTDYISFPMFQDVRGCIEMWVKPDWDHDSGPGSYPTLCEKAYGAIRYNPAVARFYYAYYDSTNTFRQAQFDVEWDADEVFHIAFSWDIDGFGDGEYHKCYKNGVEQNGITVTYGIWTATYTGSLKIGNQTSASGFVGTLDNVKVWNYGKTDFSDRFKEYTPVDQMAQPVDSGGFAQHGVMIGGGVEQRSFRGPCYSSNGTSSQYIDCKTGVCDGFGDGVTAIGGSFWFQSDYPGDGDGILYMGDFSNSQGELAILVYNNELYFRLANNTFGLDTPFSDNMYWHHVAFSYDGSNPRLWLDGELKINGSYVDSLDLSGLKLIIGAYYSSSYAFDGSIKDVQLFDHALTDEDAAVLFRGVRHLISLEEEVDPVHRLPLDELIVRDVGMSATPVLQSGAELKIDIYRKAFHFTKASSHYLDLESHSTYQLVDDFTIAVWVKADTDMTTGGTIAGCNNSSGSDKGWTLYVATTGGKMAVHFKAGTSSTWGAIELASNAILNTGQWYHIAVTRNGTDTHLYIDGYEVAYATETTTSSAIAPCTTKNMEIGRDTETASNYWDGMIAEFVIYDRALSLVSCIEVKDQSSYGLKVLEPGYKAVAGGNTQDGLVIWNRMGSRQEVYHSEVGVPGIHTGSLIFVPNKFGAGYYSPSNSNYIDFNIESTRLSLNAFTVEFWLSTPFSVTSGVPSDTQAHDICYLGLGSDGWQKFVVYFSAAALVGRIYSTNPNVYTMNASPTWNENTPVHIAYVVDRNGINGSSDTMRVYINGVEANNHTTAIADTVSVPNTVRAPAIPGWADPTGVNIHNLKVWNYSKTTFDLTDDSDVYEDAPDFTDWEHMCLTWKTPDLNARDKVILWNKLESTTSEIGNNGTLENKAPYYIGEYTKGKFNNGYRQSGRFGNDQTDHIYISHEYQGKGCLEVWLKPNWAMSTVSDGTRMFHLRGSYTMIELQFYSSTGLNVTHNVTGGASYLNLLYANFDIQDEELFHFAYVWDWEGIEGTSDKVRVYKNGVRQGVTSGSETSAIYSGTHTCWLRVGNNSNKNRGFGGVLDNLIIWDYAKTDHLYLAESPVRTTKKLYINGELRQVLTTSEGLTVGGTGLILGANSLLQNQGNIVADNIVVSKREFSETEVRQLSLSKYIK